MIIQHNMQAMFANGKLSGVEKQTAKSTEKLSSGYRINRAADDAAGLSISEKMRVQIRGLNQASENIQDGNSLVGVADSALNEVHSIMQRQRELLVQAGNDTNTDSDRQAIEDELSALSQEFDRIFDDTEFNTTKIFRGEETILSGPTLTAPTTTTTNTTNGTPQTTTKTVWLPKSPAPDLNPPATTTTTTQTVSETVYTENEKEHDVDALGHTSYEVEEITSTTTTTTATTTTEKTTYALLTDPDYTNLKPPGVMVGSGGYINVSNVKGDLPLSCAMSQLGVKVDGQEVSLDVYYDGAIPKSTVISPDGNTAETTYDLGNDIKLTQIIELKDNDKYLISYKIENTGTTDRAVDVRLAFDVMNTAVTSINDNTTKSFNLEADIAKININAGDATKAVLGKIDNLYNTWADNTIDGTPVSHHTGVGYWWEGSTAMAGTSMTFGPVSYGPIELKQDPYTETTTKTTDVTVTEQRVDATTTYVYLPTYLDIQAGALAQQNIPIRLWDLSADKLKAEVPTDISAFSTDSSLVNMDKAIQKISSIRSYYGAIYNRLEYAQAVDDNTEENTQASESRIRDLDMADEMVIYSKNSILSQFGQSVLAQSSQIPNRVLELLQ